MYAEADSDKADIWQTFVRLIWLRVNLQIKSDTINKIFM